jgi:hypothetical protein
MKMGLLKIVTLSSLLAGSFAYANAFQNIGPIHPPIVVAPLTGMTIQCPQMDVIATPDPSVSNNGFYQHGFLVSTPRASISTNSYGTFLYCSADYFGGAWMSRLEPAGYTCSASGSAFYCTRNQ